MQASLDALVAQDVAVQTRCDPYAAAQQKLKGQPLALQLVCALNSKAAYHAAAPQCIFSPHRNFPSSIHV